MRKPVAIVLAVKALIATAIPAADLRGFDKVTSATVRAEPGGTIVGRLPENEIEPTEVDLSPVTYHFEMPLTIELLAPPVNADQAAAWINDALSAIGAAIVGNRTLGGLCSFLDASLPMVSDVTPEGSNTQRFASVVITASFSTTDPLN